jgi:hypothetical protein
MGNYFIFTVGIGKNVLFISIYIRKKTKSIKIGIFDGNSSLGSSKQC